MRELDPKIELQLVLGQQIMNVLQGPTIEAIRQDCVGLSYDFGFRSAREGNSLKVSETLLPQLYNICEEVKEKLGFKTPIDFYVSGNSEVNACAFFAYDENSPHIIEINSGLFNLMNEEELKYVIGHEIGHLINGDSIIRGIFNFIYPDDEAMRKCPDFLLGRYRMYRLLAELSADRYGYIANENLEACVTAIFKMASGLNLEKMNVSMKALMTENDQRLEFFLREGNMGATSHPANPVRVRALDLFANTKTQTALTKGMNELIDILQDFMYSRLDQALADFVASAGIMISQIDGKREKYEEEYLIKELAQFTLFPYKYLKQVEKGDVNKIFEESFKTILELSSPEDDITPMNYILELVIADRYLDERELSIVYDLGKRMGMTGRQVSMEIAEKLREKFQPNVTGLK